VAENVTACEYPIIFACFQLPRVMCEKAIYYSLTGTIPFIVFSIYNILSSKFVLILNFTKHSTSSNNKQTSISLKRPSTYLITRTSWGNILEPYFDNCIYWISLIYFFTSSNPYRRSSPGYRCHKILKY
jgi:hypothetical protein